MELGERYPLTPSLFPTRGEGVRRTGEGDSDHFSIVGQQYCQIESKLMGQSAEFEQIVMPHLDAAYNLARWLAGNDHDAEDIVQDACVRAYRFLEGYRGVNDRAWLLTIVRNTAYSWFKKNRPQAVVSLDKDEFAEIPDESTPAAFAHTADAGVLRTALESLPTEFREALVLRELEGLSYKEISEVADVPVGTVMSRLSRARRLLQRTFERKGEISK
jgi:RNA polymerase sigma-70 factor (ECF subfamily)